MGTRAIIARKTEQGEHKWEGRYHHCDGYPTGLGAMLWELYHGNMGREFTDLDEMMATLIDDHPAGWSTISGDWNYDPRWTDGVDRCLICGKKYMWKDEGDTKYTYHGDVSGHPFTTPPQCYCHGERNEDGRLFTPDNFPIIGIEYIYIIDPETGEVEIKDAYGKGHDLGTVNLDAEDEPDWEAIEAGEYEQKRDPKHDIPFLLTMRRHAYVTQHYVGNDEWRTLPPWNEQDVPMISFANREFTINADVKAGGVYDVCTYLTTRGAEGATFEQLYAVAEVVGVSGYFDRACRIYNGTNNDPKPCLGTGARHKLLKYGKDRYIDMFKAMGCEPMAMGDDTILFYWPEDDEQEVA